MHSSNRRLEIDPGCRNCNHGLKKKGVTWIPSNRSGANEMEIKSSTTIRKLSSLVDLSHIAIKGLLIILIQRSNPLLYLVATIQELST